MVITYRTVVVTVNKVVSCGFIDTVKSCALRCHFFLTDEAGSIADETFQINVITKTGELVLAE